MTPAAGNQRTFSYNSLGRLLSAGNPETTNETYLYDENGNLTVREDQRGISTLFSYSGLDQLIEKTYSDYASSSPTPWPSYYYNRGWLTEALVGGTGNTTVVYGSFDGLGRPQSVTQNTGTQSFPFTVAYAASDAISSVTNPWGRTITTTFDRAGRVSAVSGSKNQVNTPYAGSFGYAPQGAVTSMTTHDGVTHAAGYNAQLQTSGVSATGILAGQQANLLSLTLGYSGSGNNGNVVSQQITRQYLNGSAVQTFFTTQNYGYTDGMNRLDSASEGGNWSDTYVYDCMSNRAVTGSSSSSSLASNFTPQTASGSSCVLGSSSPSLPFDANNHWTAASYDLAGNMTAVSTQTMQYDGERRLTQLQDTGTNPVTTVTYGYDADGRRVVKTSAAGTTIYVYGPDGELAGESSTVPSTATGTQYLTTDHLGSTRLTTDANGNPVSCHDYVPFGQEIPATWGSRSGVPCYASAAVDTDLKFTGQVRDGDTTPGLDQFGYRYLSGAQGRFMSPDPFNAGADPGNPQSWNMYS